MTYFHVLHYIYIHTNTHKKLKIPAHFLYCLSGIRAARSSSSDFDSLEMMLNVTCSGKDEFIIYVQKFNEITHTAASGSFEFESRRSIIVWNFWMHATKTLPNQNVIKTKRQFQTKEMKQPRPRKFNVLTFLDRTFIKKSNK